MSEESEGELAAISAKLNVLIALMLRDATNKGFSGAQKPKKIGDQARYLAGLGVSPKDIALILEAPLTSIRTLLTPSQRKK